MESEHRCSFHFSAMFDWDDEELSDIIWGETGGDDDHLVSYQVKSDGKPPASHREGVSEAWNIEALSFKHGDQNKLETKSASHIKLESSTKQGADEARPTLTLSKDSWSGLSSCEESSKNAIEISKHEDGSVQQGTNSEVIQKQQVDGEQSDFIDYDWDNIRSFDDLEKIFSNDNPIFGHSCLPSTDELWPSTKDLPSGPDQHFLMCIESPNLGLGELQSTIENTETEEEYMLDQYQPFSRAYNEVSNITPTASEMIPTYDGDEKIPIVKQQENPHAGQGQIISEEHGQTSQSGSTSIKELNNQYLSVSQHCQSVVPSQPSHLQGAQCLQYNQNLSSPDFTNQYQMTFTPLTMTPQEKIEKLKRRQQMRAMMAIQRQQQQLSDQLLSPTDHSMEAEGSFHTPPSSAAHPNSSVLNQLQEIISKLDVRIRLCIRDSLFRLAQSAAQRQHTDNDTKGIQEVAGNKEESTSNTRIARLPNVEAETNPIDRTVAHLLFHQPLEVLSTNASKDEAVDSGVMVVDPPPHPPTE